MAMSQLSGRQSLRDIESNLEAQQEKLYHLGAKPIARSSLARFNENQPSKHKFRFKNSLFSLDASAIDLSLSFSLGQHQPHAANVKLSVGLNHGNWIPEFVPLSDGNENDRAQGRKFTFPKGSIVAFDKEYNDYGWYKSLTDQRLALLQDTTD